MHPSCARVRIKEPIWCLFLVPSPLLGAIRISFSHSFVAQRSTALNSSTSFTFNTSLSWQHIQQQKQIRLTSQLLRFAAQSPPSIDLLKIYRQISEHVSGYKTRWMLSSCRKDILCTCQRVKAPCEGTMYCKKERFYVQHLHHITFA